MAEVSRLHSVADDGIARQMPSPPVCATLGVMIDQVLFNARIITLDERNPSAEAMALAGEKIAFVGTETEARAMAWPATQFVDLGRRTLVPGFCDSHIHLVWFGVNLLYQADLVGSRDVEEILSRLSGVAGRTDGWIRGHGFDQSKLAEKRFPTLQELDRVSQARPVVISRVCGHAGVVNSAALAMMSPEQRAAGDESSGLYTENALWAFYQKQPMPSEPQMEQAILAAADVLLKSGITSVQTLLDVPQQMIGFSRLHRAGRLPIRVVAMPPWSAALSLHELGVQSCVGDHWLKFGAAKLFSDGSLGAQTALLSSPYADKPDTCGLRIYEPADLCRRVLEAQEQGFQVAIHAIGDQAVRECIDAIEFALARDPDRRDNSYHRHRIEHVSLCPPDCIERIARSKIVCTLQPQFVTSDTWTGQRIGGARVPWAYPFASLAAAGVPITLSSDCPVEFPDAFACLASAVGGHAWRPGETLTVDQALRAYCVGSAYAGHVEHQQGCLAAGKLADFVVLSGDPRTLDAGGIRSLRAEQVYVGGKLIRQVEARTPGAA